LQQLHHRFIFQEAGQRCFYYQGDDHMIRIPALLLLSVLAVVPQLSSAKGCLKGAAVGGVAGHVAGGHGAIGAAAGCAVGRHRANKKEKLAAQQAQQAPVAAPAR
jgi:hypothetical protein